MTMDESTRKLLLALAEGDIFTAWQNFAGYADRFCEAVTLLTGEAAIVCDDCGDPTWRGDTERIGSGRVCEGCIENNYSRCDRCERLSSSDEFRTVGGSDWCEDCSNYASYCEHCDEYYADGDEDDHSHSCDCEAPHPTFTFPANGAGTVEADERLTVTLPAGVIDDAGISAITQLVYKAFDERLRFWDLAESIDSIGPEWQTRKGNFTKRLSKALYERHEGVKLPAEVISEVGNLGRQHSSESAGWHVEFTRDLNQPAEAFYHDESCWWGGYSSSRCALKQWGGIGMRSYRDIGTESYHPSGRAWVQPLDADMQPTHDVQGATAYVVYNCYGALEGLVAARIIAHLTGKSYRNKVTLSLSPQYVNGSVGYLVADQGVCNETEGIRFSGNEHDKQDAHSLTRTLEVSAA